MYAGHKFAFNEALTMARRSAADKLASLRALLKTKGWAAYIVGTSDAHNSEYVSTHDSRCVVVYTLAAAMRNAPVSRCVRADAYYAHLHLNQWLCPAGC